VCCIEEIQVIETIEPVSTFLGLLESQVVILEFQSSGRRRMLQTWIILYALFCEDEEESALVLELLGDTNIISLMEGYMEILFGTLISIAGDRGKALNTEAIFGISGDSDDNLTLYWMFAIIVVFCCLLICFGGYLLHRYLRMKMDLIAAQFHRSAPNNASELFTTPTSIPVPTTELLPLDFESSDGEQCDGKFSTISRRGGNAKKPQVGELSRRPGELSYDL